MLVEANLINTSYEPEYTDIYECLSSREAVQEDLYIAKDVESFATEYAALRQADFEEPGLSGPAMRYKPHQPHRMGKV